MRSIILLISISIQLVGCVSLTQYRAKDTQGIFVPETHDGFEVGQEVSLPKDRLDIRIMASRYRSSYRVDLTFTNEANENLIFEPYRATLRSIKGDVNLPLRKVKKLNELPSEFLPEKVVILPGERIVFRYEFEGSEIGSFFYFYTNEMQRSLRLQIQGLSRHGEYIPVLIDLHKR